MKKFYFLIMGFAVLLVGCALKPKDEIFEIFNVSSTYFSNISKEEIENAFEVQGTVQLKNDKNGILTWMDVKEDTTISVTGTMERESGEIQLVYTAPDGAETVITENEDGMIDTVIKVSSGEGMFNFIGETAVCDFVFQFEITDGVSYN